MACIRKAKGGHHKIDEIMTFSTASESSSKGIDIAEALSILSARSKTGGEFPSSKSVPDELKRRGQTINITEDVEFTNPANFATCDCAAAVEEDGNSENEFTGEEDAKHEAMKQARIKRGEEIKLKVLSMGTSDLLGMIFGAQQERVSTYKMYEE